MDLILFEIKCRRFNISTEEFVETCLDSITAGDFIITFF